jgi:hypothetical protein
MPYKRKHLSSQRGFALVTAILACVILFALAMLVIQLSTGDLRVSAKSVGDKKAMSAAEAGLHRMMQTFDPGAPATGYNTWIQVDATNDPASRYRITTPAALGTSLLPLPGYSMEAGKGYGMAPYTITVTGENTTYNTHVEIDVGVGYAPIPTGTAYQ